MSSENNHDDNIASEIFHYEERLVDAMRNSDIDHLDFLIHDDLIFIGPDGIPVSKMMDLEKYRAGAIQISQLDATNQQIRTFGDTAVVYVHITLAGVHNGENFSNALQYMRIWKMIGDSWQVIAGSCTRMQ